MQKNIENKQIGIEEIYQIADLLEAEKSEWEAKVQEDKELQEGKEKEKYSKYQSELTCTVEYKDGRKKEDQSIEWVKDNILEFEDWEYVVAHLYIRYYDLTQGDTSYHDQERMMSITIHFDIGDKYLSRGAVSPSYDTNNLDYEIDMISLQIKDMIAGYDKTADMAIFNKVFRYLESYKKEFDEKARESKEKYDLNPVEENNYDFFRVETGYEIAWRDGRSKEEPSYEWFKDNTKNTNDIHNIKITYYLHFYDGGYSKGGTDKSIHLYMYFKSDEEHSYNSEAYFSIDGDNCDSETDELHNKLNRIINGFPTRYDAVLKQRTLRTQAFSIAVGLILSYLFFGLFKALLAENEFCMNLLTNKYVIIFGQWVIAVIFGNVFGRWYMEMLYKTFAPRRKYDRYDASSHREIYKDDLVPYKEDSEIQLGKFYNLKENRAKTGIVAKYSAIVILVHLVISGILYLVLK